MRRVLRPLALPLLLVVAWPLIRTPLLNALLYFPFRELEGTPGDAGLAFSDVTIETEDGRSLHGWWVPAAPRRESPVGAAPAAAGRALGHVLHFHGNAGNISHRLMEAQLLAGAGFDVLLLDYRGYGNSTGSPDEAGTYRDARAALRSLLARPEVDPSRVLYVGESLGGAVALALAVEAPPAGLVLQSTFTSVRDMARVHYFFIPAFAVPDAYPSLSRIAGLKCPLLVIHGDRDDIVPFRQGEALYRAAPEPKRFVRAAGSGHNDLVLNEGSRWSGAIAEWAREVARDR